MQKNKIKNRRIFYCFCIILSAATIAGCSSSALVEPTDEPNEVLSTSTKTIEATIPPTSTPIPATPTPPQQTIICSPLEGETLTSIQEIITQPFKQPRIGIDDGPPTHHGVDFSHYRRNDLLSIEGVGIQSVLDGEVVTVINDKYPYGIALIIETPLDSIAPELLSQIEFPAVEPTVIPDPKFNWSPMDLPFELSTDSRSLYVYYAHLQQLPVVQVGDKVSCGQLIGQVGNTGDSTNPHLHFETRIGPSGARFESMAYYSTHATESERYNYILWRVSNLFQLFDPMKILDIKG